MKKIILFILCVSIYITACGRGGGASRDSDGALAPAEPNPLESGVMQTLELAVYDGEKHAYQLYDEMMVTKELAYSYLMSVAKKFQEDYPFVTVNVNVICDSDEYAYTLKNMIMYESYVPDLLLAPRGGRVYVPKSAFFRRAVYAALRSGKRAVFFICKTAC